MKKAIIFIILILLLAGNVEAYHTTNKYGRYDDQNPKNHKDIVIINNNYNIHHNIIINNDGHSRSSYYRPSSRYTRTRYNYDRGDGINRYYHNKRYSVRNSRYNY
ncbi:hypothetical protein HYX17_05450 [Candidatus Woesearchaeota archaeon]|nr:hypothetical protein [Candidatus Woesearchaeota archaeon]